MQKYLLLITISLALIATIILAGLFFAPATYTDTNDHTQSDGQVSFENMQISTVNSATEPEFFTFGDEYGQAIFVELTATQQDDQIENFTLVTAPAGLDLQPENSNLAMCSENGSVVVSPPPGTMAGLDKTSKHSPYLERLARLFDLPLSTQYIITMWHPTTQSDDYILVSADGLNDDICPYLLDEGV